MVHCVLSTRSAGQDAYTLRYQIVTRLCKTKNLLLCTWKVVTIQFFRLSVVPRKGTLAQREVGLLVCTLSIQLVVRRSVGWCSARDRGCSNADEAETDLARYSGMNKRVAQASGGMREVRVREIYFEKK